MSLTLNGNRTGRAAASYNAEIRNQLSNDAMIEASKERARRAALCLEVSQEIRDMMTQEQYDAWWEVAPEVGYLEYAQAELARLQSIPHPVDLATSAEPVPDEEAEIADTLAMVGAEVQHMTSNLYDFTDMPKDMPIIDMDQIDEIPF